MTINHAIIWIIHISYIFYMFSEVNKVFDVVYSHLINLNFLSGRTDAFGYFPLNRLWCLISDFVSGVKKKSVSGCKFFSTFGMPLTLVLMHLVWDLNNSQFVLAFEITSSLLTLRHTSLVKSMKAVFVVSLFLLHAIAAFLTCSFICNVFSFSNWGK